jgi:hypothetical protein
MVADPYSLRTDSDPDLAFPKRFGSGPQNAAFYKNVLKFVFDIWIMFNNNELLTRKCFFM